MAIAPGHGRTARRWRAHEVPIMLPRRLRRPLLWSPIVALAAQLLFAAAVAAATGGGDFPRFRGLLMFL